MYDKEYYERQSAGYNFTKERKSIFQYYLKTIKDLSPNVKKILDVGSGFGYFLHICDLNNIRTFGIDVSEHAIQKASKFTNAKILDVDINKENLPFEDNTFDAVTLFGVIEHIKNDKWALTQVHRVLRNNGIVFITTPNGQFIGKRFLRNEPTHINVQDMNYWKKTLEKIGFSDISIKFGMLYGFPPSSKLRRILGIAFIKLIFTPIKYLGQELIMWGKNYDGRSNYFEK